jgi:hypothetical protein
MPTHDPALFIADAPSMRRRPVELPRLSQWGLRYPDAARLLGQWSLLNNTTAQRLGSWAHQHPVEMETLVNWAITNVGESLGAFFLNRWGWDDFRQIADGARPAVEEFVLWVRRAPTAAMELVAHPDGLEFATLHGEQLMQARQESDGDE